MKIKSEIKQWKFTNNFLIYSKNWFIRTEPIFFTIHLQFQCKQQTEVENKIWYLIKNDLILFDQKLSINFLIYLSKNVMQFVLKWVYNWDTNGLLLIRNKWYTGQSKLKFNPMKCTKSLVCIMYKSPFWLCKYECDYF